MNTKNQNFDCTELSLSGIWKLSGTDDDGNALECSATVPGDVHSALFDAGLIPDPFHGRNERRVQWVGRHDWTFSRKFEVDAAFATHRNVILRLEDCDTFATVFVNGTQIGKAGNRFRRWDFDVRQALKPGENEISITFESAWMRGDALAAKAGRPYPMSVSEINLFNNGAFIRKPACHRGWDWGLAQMTTGPCGRVSLIASDGARIDYVYSTQEFNDDLSHCTLHVFAEIEDGRTVESTIEIDNPPLWWPSGQGEQRFVQIGIDGTGHASLVAMDQNNGKTGAKKDESSPETCAPGSMRTGMPKTSLDGKFAKTLRIGLRKLELDTTGGAVCFKINGRPTFMKGANWIPCDAFDSRQTPDRYRELLESAKTANMNMIRLWGGGQFEKDVFYDLCDELGLLVWHDLMFSCAVYPADAAFLEEIRAETVHQLKRLRDHACIALWCGDNECIGAARGWFQDTIPDSERPKYIEECRRRIETLEAAVAEADPTRRFWPSSPCAGEADFDHDAWHEDSRGDMHCWDVWAENAPFSRYLKYRPRFCSEFGFQSFPSAEVAATFCTKPFDDDFEWHQKCLGGNDRIRKTMARHFSPPANAREALYLSQVQQAMAIETAVEAWRTLRPHCMGTLYWQLNDLWPVSSWSGIEYGGKWKHLHYRARRFFSPLAIVAKPSRDGRDIELWAINDADHTVNASATVRLLSFDGNVLARETLRAALPPNAATLLASRSIESFGGRAERSGRFLALEMDGAPRNDYFFATFKDAPIPAATVTTAFDGFRVTLSTDAPAFFVWANVEGIRGEFDDNSFTLLPGEPRTLVFFPKDASTTPDAFRHAFSLTHISPSR